VKDELKEAVRGSVKVAFWMGMNVGSRTDIFVDGKIHNSEDLKKMYDERISNVEKLIERLEN
jgi:hypothetical protein